MADRRVAAGAAAGVLEQPAGVLARCELARKAVSVLRACSARCAGAVDDALFLGRGERHRGGGEVGLRIGQYGAFGEGAAKVRMRQRFAQGNAMVAEAVQRVAQFEAAHVDALPFSFRAWRFKCSLLKN